MHRARNHPAFCNFANQRSRAAGVSFGDMNPPSPPKCLRSLLCWRTWLLIFAAAALVFLIVNARSRGASKPVSVDIRLNTNGIPTVVGIPLGNGSVRDFTLRTLSQTKVPVRVLVPSGGSSAPGWDSNSVQTLNAIIKAGLIPTNKPSGPSPYE